MNCASERLVQHKRDINRYGWSYLKLQKCLSGHSCQWNRLCFGPWWWKPAEVLLLHAVSPVRTVSIHHTVKCSDSTWKKTFGRALTSLNSWIWACSNMENTLELAPSALFFAFLGDCGGFDNDTLIRFNTDGTIITWLSASASLIIGFTVTHALMITSRWSANLPSVWGH